MGSSPESPLSPALFPSTCPWPGPWVICLLYSTFWDQDPWSSHLRVPSVRYCAWHRVDVIHSFIHSQAEGLLCATHTYEINKRTNERMLEKQNLSQVFLSTLTNLGDLGQVWASVSLPETNGFGLMSTMILPAVPFWDSQRTGAGADTKLSWQWVGWGRWWGLDSISGLLPL